MTQITKSNFDISTSQKTNLTESLITAPYYCPNYIKWIKPSIFPFTVMFFQDSIKWIIKLSTYRSYIWANLRNLFNIEKLSLPYIDISEDQIKEPIWLTNLI